MAPSCATISTAAPSADGGHIGFHSLGEILGVYGFGLLCGLLGMFDARRYLKPRIWVKATATIVRVEPDESSMEVKVSYPVPRTQHDVEGEAVRFALFLFSDSLWTSTFTSEESRRQRLLDMVSFDVYYAREKPEEVYRHLPSDERRLFLGVLAFIAAVALMGACVYFAGVDLAKLRKPHVAAQHAVQSDSIILCRNRDGRTRG